MGLRLTPGGNENISTRSGHDDRVSALVHVLHYAEQQAPMLGGRAPMTRAFGRSRYDGLGFGAVDTGMAISPIRRG